MDFGDLIWQCYEFVFNVCRFMVFLEKGRKNPVCLLFSFFKTTKVCPKILLIFGKLVEWQPSQMWHLTCDTLPCNGKIYFVSTYISTLFPGTFIQSQWGYCNETCARQG